MVKGDSFWIAMHFLIITTYLLLNFEFLHRHGFCLNFCYLFIDSMFCCLFVPSLEIRFECCDIEPPLSGWGGLYFSHVFGFLLLIPFFAAIPINNFVIVIYIFVGVVFLFWVLLVVFLPIVLNIFLNICEY